jgi:SAM-dependent methyltransferase
MDKHSLQRQYDARYDGGYMDADAYTQWVHEGLAAHRVRQTLQQIVSVPTNVLDYGCGQGKWVALLRDVFPQARLSGIDISAVAVEKATLKHPDCQFSAFDGDRAPHENETFDLVFSFHVLEHVLDVELSIKDMARLLRPGGHACIIFPCGNRNSFEDRLVRLFSDGRQCSPTGETIFFFEGEEGHLRRMESSKAIELFARQRLHLMREFYSGQFFASLDWLVRGTGPHYINGLFNGKTPRSRFAVIELSALRRLLLGLHRFIGFRHIDLNRPRAPPKQAAARFIRSLAAAVDNGIMQLARWEWRHRRNSKAGSVQYLVFRKEG